MFRVTRNHYFFFCRCGALSIGDQILSIDETVIENTALSPDDVMLLLDANSNKGYTQLQIMPSHAIARRGKIIIFLCGKGISDALKRK